MRGRQGERIDGLCGRWHPNVLYQRWLESRRTRTLDMALYGEGRGQQVRDRMEGGRRDGSRTPSAEYRDERGGKGCDCTGSNRRNNETFQGGTGSIITRFPQTALTAPIETRHIYLFLYLMCLVRVPMRQCF